MIWLKYNGNLRREVTAKSCTHEATVFAEGMQRAERRGESSRGEVLAESVAT